MIYRYFGLAPMTGLIVQPIIGYFSDRTWHQNGVGDDHFFIGALLASLAFIIHAQFFQFMDLQRACFGFWMHLLIFLWNHFVHLLGTTYRMNNEPLDLQCKVFLLEPGAYIASWLPTIFDHFGVANTASEGMVPVTVKYSFLHRWYSFLFYPFYILY